MKDLTGLTIDYYVDGYYERDPCVLDGQARLAGHLGETAEWR